MMMILSLSIGALIGEWIDLDRRTEQFGQWLKMKTGNAKDRPSQSFFCRQHSDFLCWCEPCMGNHAHKGGQYAAGYCHRCCLGIFALMRFGYKKVPGTVNLHSQYRAPTFYSTAKYF